MASTPPPAWTREFNPGKISNWTLLGIPGSLIFGAFFFFIAGNFHQTLFRTAGPVVAVAGSCIFFWIWRAGETTRLVCGPEGFLAETTSRRKGTRQENYRWSEVIATHFWVSKTESKDELPTYFQNFSLETTRDQKFAYNQNFRPFDELIDLCNAMTTHLPYVWLPRPPGQDWEYVPAPQVLSGQLRPVEAHAKFFCSSRQTNPPPPAAPPVMPMSAAPPPIPPAF